MKYVALTSGRNEERFIRQTVEAVLAGTYRQYKAGDDAHVILNDRVLTLREFATLWVSTHKTKHTLKQAVGVLRKRIKAGYEPADALAKPPILKDPRRNRIRNALRRDPWPVERIPAWNYLTALLYGRI